MTQFLSGADKLCAAFSEAIQQWNQAMIHGIQIQPQKRRAFSTSKGGGGGGERYSDLFRSDRV